MIKTTKGLLMVSAVMMVSAVFFTPLYAHAGSSIAIINFTPCTQWVEVLINATSAEKKPPRDRYKRINDILGRGRYPRFRQILSVLRRIIRPCL